MIHYTTIEQSKKLVELGLNPDTADMKWYYWKDEIDAPKIPTLGFDKAASESYKNTQAIYQPCWSLGALLEVMPIIDDHTYHLSGTLNRGAICEHPCTCVMFQEESPIEAAYNMVVWLVENGYIKKEK